MLDHGDIGVAVGTTSGTPRPILACGRVPREGREGAYVVVYETDRAGAVMQRMYCTHHILVIGPRAAGSSAGPYGDDLRGLSCTRRAPGIERLKRGPARGWRRAARRATVTVLARAITSHRSVQRPGHPNVFVQYEGERVPHTRDPLDDR